MRHIAVASFEFGAALGQLFVGQLAQSDGFVQEFPDKYDTYIEQGGTNVSGGIAHADPRRGHLVDRHPH